MPSLIHPSLWRASQLYRPLKATVNTGFHQLNQHLPGGGWPVGSLIEIMPSNNGVGEIKLIQPALAQLEPELSIALVNPPYMPSSLCLSQWFSARHRIFWVRPQNTHNALWAAQQILQHNTCSALVCWFNHASSTALHRLHVTALQSSTLFFAIRPINAATQSSAAILRLLIQPQSYGISANIIKRQGPCINKQIPLFISHVPGYLPSLNHHHHEQTAGLGQHIFSAIK